MKFSKYHGLGNDFIITRYKEGVDFKELAIKLAAFHTGIGADGFIVVKENPLEMVFYNQDGTEAPMCGNGIRAFAMYAFANKLVNSHIFPVKTKAGTLEVVINNPSLDNFLVKINMGSPIFDNKMIKVNDNINSFGRNILVNDKEYSIYSFFMGTIHTVILKDNLDDITLDEASKLCNYKLFEEKSNINFVAIKDRKNIYVKTYERGVGFTYACGTGACASYVALKKLGLVDDIIKVHLKFGYLTISMKDENVYMEGPACHVFDTEIEVK